MVTYYTEADLVSFGNFLLSDKRATRFAATPKEGQTLHDRLSCVHDADFANWEDERKRELTDTYMCENKEFNDTQLNKKSYSLLPSRFQIGDLVEVIPEINGEHSVGKVDAVVFKEDTVYYDIRFSPSPNSVTVMKDVDSALVYPKK